MSQVCARHERDETLRASGMEAAIAAKERLIQSGFVAQQVEIQNLQSQYRALLIRIEQLER